MEEKRMFVEERHKNIYEYIKAGKRATLAELCERFDVSPATMRNDLDAIQKQGRIKRTHGGAIFLTQTGYESPRSDRSDNREAKIAIAKYAASLVEDGDSIVIDQGTTTLEMIPFLAEKKNITVVVNDLEIAVALEKDTTASIVLLGGQLRREYSSTYGSMTQKCLENINVDKAFLGANAISLEKGLTTPHVSTADVKQEFVRSANEIIALVESAKFGRMSLYKFMDCTDLNLLITDKGIDRDILAKFRESGVNIEEV